MNLTHLDLLVLIAHQANIVCGIANTLARQETSVTLEDLVGSALRLNDIVNQLAQSVQAQQAAAVANGNGQDHSIEPPSA